MLGQGRKQGSSGSGDAAGNLVHVIGPSHGYGLGKVQGTFKVTLSIANRVYS